MTILEPIKEIGGMTVYQRKPQPIGATKYTVGRTGGKILLEDFRTKTRAIQWAKNNCDG